MDVIILGGGLMGSSVAYFPARRGVPVTLVERAFVGAGATVASFGNVRRSGRALEQLALARRSPTLWAKWGGSSAATSSSGRPGTCD